MTGKKLIPELEQCIIPIIETVHFHPQALSIILDCFYFNQLNAVGYHHINNVEMS